MKKRSDKVISRLSTNSAGMKDRRTPSRLQMLIKRDVTRVKDEYAWRDERFLDHRVEGRTHVVGQSRGSRG